MAGAAVKAGGHANRLEIWMRNLVVWAETGADGAQALDQLRRGTALRSCSSALYRQDRGSGHVLLLQTDAPADALAAAREVAELARPALAPDPLSIYLRVHEQTTSNANTDDVLLTVRLPVPAGREHEWNAWYAEEHLPGVLAQVGPDIRAGSRYAPVGLATEYLVAYEFTSIDSVRAWVDSQGVRNKRSDYEQRWGVRNTMRTLVRT